MQPSRRIGLAVIAASNPTQTALFKALSRVRERDPGASPIESPIAAARRNFAGPVVIGRDLMEV